MRLCRCRRVCPWPASPSTAPRTPASSRPRSWRWTTTTSPRSWPSSRPGERSKPMIPRYSLAPMADLFTDEARFAAWIEVEVLAVEAWARLGVIPSEDARAVRQRAPESTPALVEAVGERERVTDHDVAAFVDVVQEHIGPPAGKWVHYGLTSSDVVDTALCLMLTRATDV